MRERTVNRPASVTPNSGSCPLSTSARASTNARRWSTHNASQPAPCGAGARQRGQTRPTARPAGVGVDSRASLAMNAPRRTLPSWKPGRPGGKRHPAPPQNCHSLRGFVLLVRAVLNRQTERQPKQTVPEPDMSRRDTPCLHRRQAGQAAPPASKVAASTRRRSVSCTPKSGERALGQRYAQTSEPPVPAEPRSARRGLARGHEPHTNESGRGSSRHRERYVGH